MRSLREVYESARSSIPLRRFPDRDGIPPWDELEEIVRGELEALQAKILSVVADDTRLLANHHRVIREFNHGVREGYLAHTDVPTQSAAADVDSLGPFYWGVVVGRRARGHFGGESSVLRQFLTASHLLEYEFGQLDEACKRPFEFLLRSLGPEHRDEYRELAFSLPVLINYEAAFVKRLIGERSFDFPRYHATLPAAPSHLEYLEHLVAALFDPDPLSWIRAAVFAKLATVAFKDGQDLSSEHFLAPEQAAVEIARTPIAARTLVRRQVARMELAMNWIGTVEHTIDSRLDATPHATLWDVYLLSEASMIHSGDNFGDLLAGTVVLSLSEQIEAALPPDQTRLEFIRRCFAAFFRGFDARHESVVEARSLAWVARGRAISEGLRRFPEGGPYIAAASVRLGQLSATVTELRHAIDDPVDFVCARLRRTHESVVAERLLEILETNHGLAEDLFSTNAAFQFSSRAQIQTYNTHDLLRSALFHIAQGARPDIEEDDERAGLIEKGRQRMRDLIAAGTRNLAASQSREPTPAEEREAGRVESGKLFLSNFDTLVRVTESALRPLYLARILDARRLEYRGTGNERSLLIDGAAGV